MTAEHVRRLHAPRTHGDRDWCSHCVGWRYPCATMLALDEDEPLSVTADLEEQHARLLAYVHSRYVHPDYEYEITTGPRKAWDYADRPPEGKGWEPNLDAGRPGQGWDRFEYHEESYWRRKRAT